MIRNVVLHLHGEQPMKADIEALPTAADAGLLCTNLRTLEGRKPLSTEFLDSVFLIPYHVIRFIEVPRVSIGGTGTGSELPGKPAQILAGDAMPSSQDSVIYASAPADLPPPPAEEDEGLEHLELDAELLRRIREA